MRDEELKKIEFRLTSPDDATEFDRARAQSYRAWHAEFRRVYQRPPSSTDKDQLTFWFENKATQTIQELEKTWWAEIQKTKEDKPETRDLVGSIFGLLTIGWLFRAVNETKMQCRPPFNAEYILHFFLKREERDEVIGDLIESYGRISRRFSKRRADIWFYKQVIGSLWPLLRRAALRIGGLIWLGRILRRLIS